MTPFGRSLEGAADQPKRMSAAKSNSNRPLMNAVKPAAPAHGRIAERMKPILEINPTHALTKALAGRFKEGKDKPLIEDAAWLVLDEARLMEGASVEDPPAFAARLRRVMEKALG